MTPEELATLSHFTVTELDVYGQPVHWPDYAYRTMALVDEIRTRLGHAIWLIRGDHGPDGSAVDWWAPSAEPEQVAAAVLRAPCAWGLYWGRKGLSVHMDTFRPERVLLFRRWLAIKQEYEPAWPEILPLVFDRRDGWSYLRWSSERPISVLAELVTHARRTWQRETKGAYV